MSEEAVGQESESRNQQAQEPDESKKNNVDKENTG